MAQFRIVLPILLIFCASGAIAVAQDDPAPLHVAEPAALSGKVAGGALKAPRRGNAARVKAAAASRSVRNHKAAKARSIHKGARPAAEAAAPSASADAEKAARLAEDRKKFFERSSGFDNGHDASQPFSLNGSGGFSPAVGFKF